MFWSKYFRKSHLNINSNWSNYLTLRKISTKDSTIFNKIGSELTLLSGSHFNAFLKNSFVVTEDECNSCDNRYKRDCQKMSMSQYESISSVIGYLSKERYLTNVL